ncbi:hypothetical protein [Lacinutrix mariniflava]|uniref:hypothetical protein n=1 Tax=Lacinutrix mariniflava TaxID=342955 RepID=UPI0006E30240|nr:hypothetical protein [Lacinutrix mariniflava]
MKKLLIVALALFALQVTAQEKNDDKKESRKERMEKRQDIDPVEMAKLKTKKMTLALDLTEEQQIKVEKINIKNAESRKAQMASRKALKDANKKPTAEEKLKRENEKLDQQIATKKEMKNILTEEQYEKYSKMSKRRGKDGKHGKMKHKKGDKKQKGESKNEE